MRKERLTTLVIACKKGHVITVHLLFGNGADINFVWKTEKSPRFEACLNGKFNIAQLLLSNGADINSYIKEEASPLYVACQVGYDSIVNF